MAIAPAAKGSASATTGEIDTSVVRSNAPGGISSVTRAPGTFSESSPPAGEMRRLGPSCSVVRTITGFAAAASHGAEGRIGGANGATVFDAGGVATVDSVDDAVLDWIPGSVSSVELRSNRTAASTRRRMTAAAAAKRTRVVAKEVGPRGDSRADRTRHRCRRASAAVPRTAVRKAYGTTPRAAQARAWSVNPLSGPSPTSRRRKRSRNVSRAAAESVATYAPAGPCFSRNGDQ